MKEMKSLAISMKGWAFVALLFVSGTSGALLYKGMCLTRAAPGPNQPPVLYDHAYLQTLFMYAGQFLDVAVIGVSSLLQRRRRRQAAATSSFEEENENLLDDSKKASEVSGEENAAFSVRTVLLFFGPTFIDVIGSTLYNLGLKYALVSVCQMVRNCSVLFVAAMSAVCFKQYRQDFKLAQTIGLSSLIVGMLVICLVSYFCDQSQSSAPNNFLGVLLVILGSVFSSIVFVMEEVVFRRVQITGLQAVSSEGFWGVSIYTALIFTLNATFLKQDDGSFRRLEDIGQFNYMLGHSATLSICLALYVLSIVFYSYSSLEITNHVSAVARSMFDSTKTLLVWAFSLAFGWEAFDPLATPLKFLGYCLVVFGTLVYNRVVVLRCKPTQKQASGANWSNLTEETAPSTKFETWE